MSNTTIVPFPQLTSSNYNNWRFRLEIILEKEGVQSVVKVTKEQYDNLSSTEKVKHDKDDTKARCIIVQCITDKHLEYIKDSKSAHDMLKSLQNVFERKSPLMKLHIMKRLFKLKCKTDELQEHFMTVESLLRELEGAGANLDESDRVCYLLLTMGAFSRSDRLAIANRFLAEWRLKT